MSRWMLGLVAAAVAFFGAAAFVVYRLTETPAASAGRPAAAGEAPAADAAPVPGSVAPPDRPPRVRDGLQGQSRALTEEQAVERSRAAALARAASGEPVPPQGLAPPPDESGDEPRRKSPGSATNPSAVRLRRRAAAAAAAAAAGQPAE